MEFRPATLADLTIYDLEEIIQKAYEFPLKESIVHVSTSGVFLVKLEKFKHEDS